MPLSVGVGIRCGADTARASYRSGRRDKPHTHTGAALHGVWGFLFFYCHSSTPYHSQRPRTAGQRWRKLCRVALLRFLLLVKCCGQPRARRVFSDPLLRDLMGIPPALSLVCPPLAGRHFGNAPAHVSGDARSMAQRAWSHTWCTHDSRPRCCPRESCGDCDGRRAWDRLWASGYPASQHVCSPRSSAGSWWTRRPRRPS